MSRVRQLQSLADLEQVLGESARRPVLIFKHSTACPLSTRAHRHWDAFLALPASEAVALAFVRVIEERSVSLALAQRVGVRHESPQAILVKDGRALWHDSHRAVTIEALTEAAGLGAQRA